MIQLDTFVNEWNGKYLDFDGVFGFQCVDLIRQYAKESGITNTYTALPAGDAADIFRAVPDVGNAYFTKVYNNYNDTTQVPPKGAIVFWGYPYGFYFQNGWKPKYAGHTSINSQSWGTGLITFDQNWGNPNFCKYVNHNYKGMLGWLVPKK